MLAIIIQLISGAVGGNLAGSLLKGGLGTLWNSVAGIAGGGIGGQIIAMLMPTVAGAAGTGDIAGILSMIAGGGVGGGVLIAIINAVKKMM